jgi:ribosomal protein S18 acetylase RimI-like enzyme
MLRIERATHDDVVAIHHLMADTWDDTYANLFPARSRDAARALWLGALDFDAILQDAASFIEVAKDEAGRILGLIAVRPPNPTEAYVLRLYVHPRDQRCGIGGALMDSVVVAFPYAKSIRLHVEKRNRRAVAFWLKQGFLRGGCTQETVADVVIFFVEMVKRVV